MRFRCAGIAFVGLTSATGAWAGGGCPAVFHEPGEVPYRSFCDSPWAAAATGLDYFMLETFEDGRLDARGLAAAAGGVVGGPSANRDSVDLDGDGSLDGVGTSGFSFFQSDPGGGAVARMTFDEGVLGALPTHAGLVWTDGRSGPSLVTFEAFDAEGRSLGAIEASLGDAVNDGTTDEDRFLGVEFARGISEIAVSAEAGFLEIDHVQYGYDADLACAGDLDGDRVVDFDDLLLVLDAWGTCPEQPCCEDLSADGVVGFDDLLILLDAWGPCD